MMIMVMTRMMTKLMTITMTMMKMLLTDYDNDSNDYNNDRSMMMVIIMATRRMICKCRFIVVGLPLPLGETAHVLGPQQWWTDDSRMSA